MDHSPRPEPPSSVPRPEPREAFRQAAHWLVRPSIRRKILFVILISCLVPAVIILALTQAGINDVIDSGVSLFLMGRAEDIGHEIGGRISAELAMTTQIASRESERGLWSAAVVASGVSPEVETALAADNVMWVTDLVGRLLLDPLNETRLNRHFRHVMQTASRSLSTTHFINLPDNTGDQWVVITAPLRDRTGDVQGFIVRAFDAGALIESFLPRGFDDFYVSVVDSQGRRLLDREIRPDRMALFDNLLVRNPDSIQTWQADTTPTGDRQVITFHQVPEIRALVTEGRAETNWHVLCGFDLGDVQSKLASTLWFNAILGLLAVLLALSLGVLMTQRIIKPLRLLRTEVREIAAGHLDQRVEIKGRDEIGDLANNINIMAGRLEQSYADLQSKIAELRSRTGQLETLHSITQTITEQLDLDALISTFQTQSRRLVDFDGLWIARAAQGENGMRIVHAHWGAVEPPVGLHVDDWVATEGSWMGQAVMGGAPVNVADLNAPIERRIEIDSLRQAGVRSMLILPLASHMGAVGAVGFASREASHFSPPVIEMLRGVCDHLGIGLEHARITHELREFADHLENLVEERTEALKAAQTKLIQTEKFAATGKLAANVAHEINNPLGIIKNYLRLTFDNIKSAGGGRRATDPNVENLQVIQEEIDRIARIVSNLLNLYRQRPPGPQGHRVQINDEIDAIIRIAERGLEKRNIRLTLNLAEDLPEVECSPDLIRQVFLNLVRNAEDAMAQSGGGELTIATQRIGDCIETTVTDTGSGIAAEILDKVFDPFFTTKREESGTGLGLSVTFGIMDSIGGNIDVESQPGRGTTFRLTFPCVVS